MSQDNYPETELERELFRGINVPDDLESQKLILEQYKLYVETMEKLVARRQTLHSIMLIGNAFLMSVAGFFVTKVELPSRFPSGVGVMTVALAGILLSLTWQKLSKYYGLLNRRKFEVIHTLETRLPVSLFWAEWVALGKGKNKDKYQSMAQIEAMIPIIFIVCYAALILFALFLMVLE
ncbi:hypothetical protein [Gloeocapsa sp. PCC 73106]|uniref:RipA family octameric membrane protein n=1 Tax=Gloeocapsa sp. PCC 73106 TaxID=102232 RepID=UPI0002AC96B5|nr:hypothetical protein [Gloeocapsa sp. PCC 73106]ELR97402.1 hypothetical protein GLO73106DRAFT_00012120 [Gloeocapsa sp. PCC 73106]